MHIREANINRYNLRAAALIIEHGKILMVKNSDYPCYYAVGGGIEPNEGSEEAVIREVLEETGCLLEVDRLVFIEERFFVLDEQKYHQIVFYYLMKSGAKIEDGVFTDQRKETLHWLPLDSLGKYDLVHKFLQTRRLDNLYTLEHIVSRE